MKLMIVESPGKVKKLSAILGDGWKVAASVGHVRDLPKEGKSDTQIVTGIEGDYRPVYEMTERGGEVVKKLKALASEADEVYLATDPDREGESISWHLQQCLELKNPRRVTFNEVTPSAIKSALLSPRTIDVQRVAAQEARRVLDRLVGYLVSPELMRQHGDNLSAGRVQSPATRLVVERERAISAFRQTLHFGAALGFAAAAGSQWRAEWQTKPDFVSDDNPYFMDRGFAEAVAGVRAVVVEGFKEGESKRSPPAPFITSTMQQAASVTLGLDPKAAMETAQKLFDQGHITYHRTDNPNVSDESLGDIYAVAVKLGLDMADEPRRFKAKDDAQAGHPAITPTHWDVEEAGDSDDQRALYKLIRLRAIACQLADARYAVRKIDLRAEAPVNGRAVSFSGTGRTLVYPGWLKLLAGDQTEEDDEGEGAKEPANPIPRFERGQVLTATRGEVLEKKTKAPGRFTLASLVAKLDAEGIGRPATYASIMDNIVTRGYVEVVKKYVRPTGTGEKIVDALVGKFQFVDLSFTRDVEVDLDRIAQGQATFRSVIQKLHTQLVGEIATQQATVAARFPCPECGMPLRRIRGEKGAFWGCSGHPNCSVSLPDEAGKPGEKKVVVVSDFACGKCGKPLIHREKKGVGGYDFFSCSGFRQGCKTAYENADGKPALNASK
jgi:DNA topoisomerase-1